MIGVGALHRPSMESTPTPFDSFDDRHPLHKVLYSTQAYGPMLLTSERLCLHCPAVDGLAPVSYGFSQPVAKLHWPY
jgi:hypothetical protein